MGRFFSSDTDAPENGPESTGTDEQSTDIGQESTGADEQTAAVGTDSTGADEQTAAVGTDSTGADEQSAGVDPEMVAINSDDVAGVTPAESTDDENGPQDDTTRELEYEDSIELPGTKETIWQTVSDPAVLARCIPGAEEVERHSEREYTATVTRGIRSLTVTLSGDVELVEMEEPDWVLASGSAYDSRSHTDVEGLAAMEMTETEANTVMLDYKATVTVTGGVASVPARVIDSLVERELNTFFEAVSDTVSGEYLD